MKKRRSSRITVTVSPDPSGGVLTIPARRAAMRERRAGLGVQASHIDSAEPRLPVAVAVWIMAAIVLVAFLQWAGGLLISLLLGIICAYTLAPFVNWLEMRRIHRAVATTLVLSVVLGGVGWVGVALSGEVYAIANQLPDIARKLRTTISKVSAGDGNVLRKMQDAASELDKAASETTGAKGVRGASAPLVAIPAPVSTTLKSWFGSNFNSLTQYVAQAVIVVLLAYALLSAGPLFRRKLLAIVGPNLSNQKEALRTLEEIQRQMQTYFLVLMATNTLIGLAIWGVFFSMGVGNPGFWGITAALLHFIPYAGPLVLAFTSGLATFLQSGMYTEALAVAMAALAVNGLIGIGVMTWMQARLYRVSAAALFLGLLFFGWLWGAWGVLLAAPLVGVMKVICDRVPKLERFAILLAP